LNTFNLRVLSSVRVLFSEQVASVFLSGDEGEFELLPFHYPLMAALPEGEIVIAGYDKIPLRQGVVVFLDNICTIIIEELVAESFIEN